MTTRLSPLPVLREQALRMAVAIKKMNHGGKRVVKFGVVMDDKTIVIRMTTEAISSTSIEALAEIIVREMMEEKGNN